MRAGEPCHLTSAPGLGSPLPTSAPGRGSPLPTSAPGRGSSLPHLHRDWARPLPTAAPRLVTYWTTYCARNPRRTWHSPWAHAECPAQRQFSIAWECRPSASFHVLADSAVPTPLRAWRLSTARSQAAPAATCCGASVHSTDEQHAMRHDCPLREPPHRRVATEAHRRFPSVLAPLWLRAQSSLA